MLLRHLFKIHQGIPPGPIGQSPAEFVRSDGITRGMGQPPVRTKHWAWLGRRAQTYTARPVARTSGPDRRRNRHERRCRGKMARRSIPRTITWWRTPGTSS